MFFVSHGNRNQTYYLYIYIIFFQNFQFVYVIMFYKLNYIQPWQSHYLIKWGKVSQMKCWCNFFKASFEQKKMYTKELVFNPCNEK
jgi:hypothetical protein